MSITSWVLIALYIKMYRIITMEKKRKFKEQFNSLLYNHLWLKYIVEYGYRLIMTVVSAFLFSFAFSAFLNPNVPNQDTIVSGGVSGLSLCIRLPFELSGKFSSETLPSVFSILYLVLNIPLLIFALKKGIGKRFVLFTIINVGLTSLFTFLFSQGGQDSFVSQVAIAVVGKSNYLGRSLFAGILVGLSSALAFYIESSAGGFDIISYTLSVKKGTSTGMYVAIIDAFILVTYNLVYWLAGHFSLAEAFTNLLFSVIYLATITIVIDLINIRNKKARVEIVTDNEDLPAKLLTHIPHGATVFKGKGVYSGKERIVVHMIVSINEVKKVVGVVKDLDPESFVDVTSLQQVYGRFHMRPVK